MVVVDSATPTKHVGYIRYEKAPALAGASPFRYDGQMNSVISLVQSDIISFVQTIGYLGMFAIALFESGIIIGAFMPGDSMLFASGFLSAHGYFSLYILIPIFILASTIGNMFGYWFGAMMEHALANRPDSLFFKRKHIEYTERFYAQYGPKAIVLARFMPVVRTFCPILAGVGSMRFPVFMLYNIIGAVLWGASLPILGFLLGGIVPEEFVTVIIIVIIVLSLLPGLVEYLRAKYR